MKKIFLLLLVLLLIVGCSNKKEISKNYELIEESSNTIVITNDKNVTDKTKVKVVKQDKDYSELSNNINKSIAYDISLSNDNENLEITSKTKVYLKMPEDFNTTKLVVYYVMDNEILDTFDVEVEKKNDIDYAVFETNHFSIYVLSELKEIDNYINKEEIKEDENNQVNDNLNEEVEDNSSTNIDNSLNDKNDNITNNSSTNSSTSKNDNVTNNTTKPSPEISTINLVGKWKSEEANTYIVFNSNGTGSMYMVESYETVEHTFNWSLSGLMLTMNYAESWLGGGTEEIKIYNENRFDMVPRRNVIYSRFNGEIPMNKTYTKNLSFKINYINIPEGLEFVYNYSNERIWYVSSTNESLLNNTYTVTYDFSSCSVGKCSLMPKFDIPDGITFLSSVVESEFELRKIRIFKDIVFNVNFLNFDSSKYNIDTGEKIFMTGVYAESES